MQNRTEKPHPHPAGLPVFLRAPRSAGLWLIGVLIALASAVAFALSYHGLFDWALHHQWPTSLAVWFPFLIDVLIVVAEVVLFVAAIDGKTPWRVRAAAWSVLVVFTALSATGNAAHAAHATPMTRGGFALPPLVLAVALGFGLGELKRQAAKYRAVPVAVPVKPPLPTVREVREDYSCGPVTEKKIRRALHARDRRWAQVMERSRGGRPIPGHAPAAQDAPAVVPPAAAGAAASSSNGHRQLTG